MPALDKKKFGRPRGAQQTEAGERGKEQNVAGV